MIVTRRRGLELFGFGRGGDVDQGLVKIENQYELFLLEFLVGLEVAEASDLFVAEA